jgi:hypothetical protein
MVRARRCSMGAETTKSWIQKRDLVRREISSRIDSEDRVRKGAGRASAGHIESDKRWRLISLESQCLAVDATWSLLLRPEHRARPRRRTGTTLHGTRSAGGTLRGTRSRIAGRTPRKGFPASFNSSARPEISLSPKVMKGSVGQRTPKKLEAGATGKRESTSNRK